MTPYQEEQLTEVIQTALGYPFKIEYEYYKGKLPLSKNGKLEEFVCEIKD